MASSNVPDVPAVVIRAITKMLVEDQQLNRPPEKAAHLLAIICKLYEQRRPFPTRREVAEKMHSPLGTVDAALSTRLDEGYIKTRVETRPGNVKKRNSVIRERYYDPNDKLFATYRTASKDAEIYRPPPRGYVKGVPGAPPTPDWEAVGKAMNPAVEKDDPKLAKEA